MSSRAGLGLVFAIAAFLAACTTTGPPTTETKSTKVVILETICHKPGNPNGGVTMTIPAQAIGPHLNHGDSLGPCGGDLDGLLGEPVIDEDREAFLDASIPDPGGAPDISIRILRGDTGPIEVVYGQDFRVPLDDLGCNEPNVEDRAACFLETFKEAFGVTDVENELMWCGNTELESGDLIVTFHHELHGFPVWFPHIRVSVTPNDEVVQVYSTLKTPLSDPGMGALQSTFAQFDEDAALDAVKAAVGRTDLEIGSTQDVLWPSRQGDQYDPIPAVELIIHIVGDPEPLLKSVVDAQSSTSIFTTADMRAALPAKRIHGFVKHPGMTRTSQHPQCTLAGGPSGCAPGLTCSFHFVPPRCVETCTGQVPGECDDAVDSFDYGCLTPPPTQSNFQLGGYCHWASTNTAEQDDARYLLYEKLDGTTPDWFNPILATHRAYAHIADSLTQLVIHHRFELGIVNSYDGMGGVYDVDIHTQCHTCSQCDLEYENCTDNATVIFGDPTINLQQNWFLFNNTQIGTSQTSEFVMGHEAGHVIIGPTYNYEGRWPRLCMQEGLADIHGSLFAVRQLGSGFPINGSCGGPATAWDDDTNGLSPGCGAGVLKNYALRSRFDGLECEDEPIQTWPIYGNCGNNDLNCPAYLRCQTISQTPLIGVCQSAPSSRNYRRIFVRIARIMADGPGVLAQNNNNEDVGLSNTPIGLPVTSRIFGDAHRQLDGGSTQQHWMELVLASSLQFNRYGETGRALGAGGYFPTTDLLDVPFATRGGPVRYHYRDYFFAQDRDFVFWRPKNQTNMIMRYHDGVQVRRISISRVDARPAVIAHGLFLHVFYRDSSNGKIKVFLISSGGFLFGPFTIDPGNGDLRPNGAFSAASFQGSLYLFFGDSDENDRITIARCDNTVACFADSSWHNYGGGNPLFKRAIGTLPILPGPAAVGASRVSGIGGFSPFDERLYLFFARRDTGRLQFGVLNANEQFEQSQLMPVHYPSFDTDAPVGIEVKQAAFPKLCQDFPLGPLYQCERNYLYLIWKERGGKNIYTSVVQNLDPFRFTRSQPSLYKTDSGVSWEGGRLPTSPFIFGVFSNGNEVPMLFAGFGRY